MSDGAPTTVIWNPSAGSADKAAGVRSRLEKRSGVRILEPGDRETTIDTVSSLAGSDSDRVVAAGGDGTVSAVIAGLMAIDDGRRPLLGILPLGTGNDLARTLAIPDDPEAALEVLADGRSGPLDVMESRSSKGTWIHANMLTAGNTGRYLEHMTDEIKERWGPLCYLRGVLDVVRDLRSYRVEIACDDDPPETFDALNLFVANGRFSGGGLDVSPRARADDGRLDLVVVRDGDPGDIAMLTSRYFAANYLEHELIWFRRAREIRIEADREMPVTADGEPVGDAPVSVRLHQGALSVVRPEEQAMR